MNEAIEKAFEGENGETIDFIAQGRPVPTPWGVRQAGRMCAEVRP